MGACMGVGWAVPEAERRCGRARREADGGGARAAVPRAHAHALPPALAVASRRARGSSAVQGSERR